MSRPITRRTPTVLSRPQATPNAHGIERVPPTTISLRFINTMRQGVFWADAMGVVTTEAGSQKMVGEEAFIIEVEYVFHRDAMVDTRELLEPIGDKLHDDLREQIAKEIAQQESRRFNHELRRFKYSVGITADELHALGGVVYLHDVDLVVGFDHQRTQFDHPHTHQGQRRRMNDSLAIEAGVQQRVMIIDNASPPYSLYLNTGQAILECRSQSNATLSDGVYVTYRDGISDHPQTHRFSLKEGIDTLGLYQNHLEAESFGKPEMRFKEQIREAEHTLTLQKQENLQLKQSLEDIKLVQERDKREWEERVANDKREYELEKERHDREKQRMRDEMEFLKYKREYSREYENDERKERTDRRKEEVDAWKSLVDVGKAGLGIVSICLSLFVLLQKNSK